ncbi:hypothetical protein ACEPAF_7111 [Sanghuangporus sanghuang]
MGLAFPHGHIVVLTIPAWGHVKAACALITKIVRLGQVYVTIFCANHLYERAIKEIAEQFIPDEENELKDLTRVVGIDTPLLPDKLDQLAESFIDEYRRLCAGEAVKASCVSEHYHNAVIPPQLVILDIFLYEAFQRIKEEQSSEIPIYVLQSVSAAALLFLWGPEHLGGHGDLSKKLEGVIETDEKAKAMEMEKIYRRAHGNLLRVPGLPDMYDHEFSPQKSVFDESGFIAEVNKYQHRLFTECDGIIMNTSSLLEKEAVDAVQKWFAGRPVICPAAFDFPLFPKKPDMSQVAIEVNEFMDDALKKHGAHSVVYMSFGSVFWPTEPDKIWVAIDAFIERGIPFVYAHASPFAEIPEEVKKRISASGLGYTSKWLPQIAILEHKACGWFVTHCGQNSVMEAISRGVPLICWPFDADQPVNAVLASYVLGIGYELFEMRSWHGLKPICRLGDRQPEGTKDAFRCEFKHVLEKAAGEDGKVKRANAQRLREKVIETWEPDGEAWGEIKRIIDILH